MKLWQKTSLICIAVLIAIVVSCSAILLIHSRNSILDLARSQAQAKQRGLAASFCEMADYYLSGKDSEAVENSLIQYCFNRFADSSSVLMKGDEILSSGVSVNPASYLSFQGDTNSEQLYEAEIEGRNILITGSRVMVQNESYTVYVVQDISTVYNSIVDILWTFVLVSVAGIVLGAGLFMLLMRRSTKPLTALAGAARSIADGEYGMRADVHTNDEIGVLAVDFNTMAGAVEEKIADLTETAERQRLLIGAVTHEFKTPLTTLLLHAHMLRRANMTDEEKDNSLEHIETQCKWLERLTQTLLKLITLEQDIKLSKGSVRELFERVRQSTQKTLEDRHVSLVMHSDTANLFMNIDLMQSLLVNLVDNASKAYDESSSVREVYLSAYDNVFEVRDNGRGISQDEVGRIFEPFYMVDKSRSKKSGGSGLGLALVKRIADAHGARLEVDSLPGEGTTVKVHLDYKKITC